ncbi:response regulator [Brevibacillus composti]|uniref:Response regulator n=1 Tax=Brevibacillus composti TaxID=2796470 RepID=A0A7T5EJU6_9BACL|nr:response regulator [Brevibacillus composti]QQE73863.1 response regulator [Brevibacillus composti]QUO40948.1 response regulator [Brevibacillus composti]
MRYFITDDDPAVRSMLMQIIEDADLGVVAGEAEDGSQIDADYLHMKRVDILLIDLLMPNRDGIETIRQLRDFEGRIVMISQIESKEMIAEAYSLGIEYYITKPINRLEVLSVLQKVQERILLQRSIEGIQRSLSVLGGGAAREKKEQPFTEKTIQTPGKFLLTELGMIGESGSKDLLEMLGCLHREEKVAAGDYKFPSLKDIFLRVARQKLGDAASETELQKEAKAAEQRVRRAIYQALSHLASLGLTDYANPKFENYASTFFDFTEVRKRMKELEDHVESAPSTTRINAKKFIYVLYLEAKRLLG